MTPPTVPPNSDSPSGAPRAPQFEHFDASAALAWLTLKVYGGRGEVAFMLTEDGDVGLFLGEDAKASGCGNTCEDALTEAHRSAHEESQTPCECEQRVESGDV